MLVYLCGFNKTSKYSSTCSGLRNVAGNFWLKDSLRSIGLRKFCGFVKTVYNKTVYITYITLLCSFIDSIKYLCKNEEQYKKVIWCAHQIFK